MKLRRAELDTVPGKTKVCDFFSPSPLSFVARSQLVLGLRLMALVASCVLVSVEYIYAPIEGMFWHREVQGSHVRELAPRVTDTYDEVLRAVFYDFTFHSVESVTVESGVNRCGQRRLLSSLRGARPPECAV